MKTRRSKTGRKYNWRPDLPDHRDMRLMFSEPVNLPASVDLRPQCPPVVDQGQIGSCSANALAGAMGFLEMADAVAKADPSVDFDASAFTAFSRLFIYFQEREIEGDVDSDGGAQIRDGVSALNQVGCCAEAEWPYDQAALYTKPTDQCVADAGSHKISQYLSLDGSDASNLKQCLAAGFPFVFGFTVYESFESAAVAATGVMPMPDPGESSLGGHAVLCVGYDDEKGAFLVRNSWGSGWGEGGHFWMPYAYMTNPDLASDYWTLRE
jgi:C1A family cysteine protease